MKKSERWGRKPGQGREKMFEVREFDSDTSFIRNYLTKQLVEELDLYVFEKKGPEWKITDKAWENIRDQLVYSRVNGGFPLSGRGGWRLSAERRTVFEASI